jgi:pSer/pThr/pTyr-binding forkhead associated (FHA) protein
MHGTFMNDRRIEKGVEYILPNGAHITFGCEVIRGLGMFYLFSHRTTC